MVMSVFEEVSKLVGENAAEALRERGLLHQPMAPLPKSPRDAMRYRVIVRASNLADFKSSNGWQLINDFQSVLHFADPAWQGYLRDRKSSAEKIWTVRGAAYKQYKLACSLGLLAWFVPIHLVPDHALSETNA